MKKAICLTSGLVMLSGLAMSAATAAPNGKAPKVDICHLDDDTQLYHVINISQNAVDQHFSRHGDTVPGTFYLDSDGDGLGDALSDVFACPNPGLVANNLDACPDEAADTADGCPAPVAQVGLDLVIGKAGEFGHKGNVRVLFHDGGFVDAPQNSFDTSHWVSVGDFDEDGQDDILVVRSNGPVFVGLGGFSSGIALTHEATVSNSPNRTGPTFLGDVNNDGHLDAVMADWSKHSVFLGNGDGTFGSEITFKALNVDNRSIAGGDFNGDGNLDVVISNQPGNTFLQVAFGDGTGNFGSHIVVGAGELVRDSVKVADIDGDGDLDIITGGWTSDLRVYENDGFGNFTLGTVVDSGTGAHTLLLVADLNGDGFPDAVTTQSNSVIDVRLNDGSGGFPTVDSYSNGPQGGATRHAILVDWNSDGNADIAMVNANPFDANGSNSVTILPGNGDGTYGAVITLPDGYRNNFTIGSGNF